MTYNVSSGTLNPTIPPQYTTLYRCERVIYQQSDVCAVSFSSRLLESCV